MTDSLQISAFFPGVSAGRLYAAWLDSNQHAAFTGSPAKIDLQVGGRFTAWEGYILGTILEIEPKTRIVQSWRTTEFSEDSPDSRLEVLLEDENGAHA